MLESASPRLAERGGPHFGSPDKDPAARLATIRMAGEQRVPFTTGILIGIGETRRERIEALLALRELHEAHGHIQEIIIQNFRPKPGTRMADAAAPTLDEHLWTIAVARLIFPSSMNIQAPPNLSPGALNKLVASRHQRLGRRVAGDARSRQPGSAMAAPARAGARDHGRGQATGRPAGDLSELRARQPKLGRSGFAHSAAATDRCRRLAAHRRLVARDGCAPAARRADPGRACGRAPAKFAPILDRAAAGRSLAESDIVRLFQARIGEFAAVCTAADALRRETCGDVVSYVVTRNINYTNICSFKCQFCAFSKGKMSENLRGRPYNLSLDEVAARAREAWQRGATEVCMQGGIHPDFTGDTYLDICRAVREAVPGMHVHAFSPLEVHQGAATLGLPVYEFLVRLKEAGLGTLPGTAAEMLDDEVRAVLCPDKINTARWLEVMKAAHRAASRPRRRSCMAMSTAMCTGRAICCACAICKPTPAASLNSFRCRSCTWRRRFT